MKKCINWNKIFANSGVAFFSTMTATGLTGSPSLEASAISALMLAGLAFFTEMKIETDAQGKGAVTQHVQKIVNAGLLV
jgi:hypothetical protein